MNASSQPCVSHSIPFIESLCEQSSGETNITQLSDVLTGQRSSDSTSNSMSPAPVSPSSPSTIPICPLPFSPQHYTKQSYAEPLQLRQSQKTHIPPGYM